MIYTTIFGYFLAVVGVFMFLPQVIETVKTKNTTNLSQSSYTMLIIGVSFWGLYGAFVGNGPNYTFNILTLISSFIFFYYLFKNNHQEYLFKWFLVWSFLIIFGALVILLTRVLNVWGPDPNSDASLVPRPMYYIVIGWVLSILATVFISISFIPQTFQVLKTKKIRVNFWFMVILWGTRAGWAIYWVLQWQIANVNFAEWLPGFISAIMVTCNQTILIVFYLAYRKNLINNN